MPCLPIPFPPTCLIADLGHASPRARVQVLRCRSSRVRRLVRTRNPLPGSSTWDAHPRTPSMMRLDLSSSILLPRGAMPFEGFSSAAAVPRRRGRCPLARRPHHLVTRVATRDELGAARRPQGLAPLSSSLSSPMLPSGATRSFLGLAYLQDFSPISRMRNVVLVLTCSRVRLGRASAPKRSVSAPTVTTGLAMSRRGGSGPTCAEPSPGAEAPRSGQPRHRPETNLRSWAVTSSGASRRSGYGALDDLPPLPTGPGGRTDTGNRGRRASGVWSSFRGAA